MGSIPGFSSLLDETLNRGPMTVFQDKLLTRTYCDEAGDYAVPNVSSVGYAVQILLGFSAMLYSYVTAFVS